MSFLKWFKSLFINPKTTVAGLTSLAGAAASIYGMTKGSVAVDATTISTTGGLVATGVGLITASDAAKDVINEAAGVAAIVTPTAMNTVDQFKQLKDNAAKAEVAIAAYQEVASKLSTVLEETK